MRRKHPPLLLALLFAVLLSACGSDKETAPQRGAQGPMQVRVAVLRPQMLENTIEATGSLLANEAIEVRSEIAGARVTDRLHRRRHGDQRPNVDPHQCR
jgi:multidrug efflux pump subunit AcrA (membrane-fusion protein)